MFMKTDYNWSDDIKKYETSKKHLQFDIPKKPEVVTHKVIKEKDLIYNPILQTYNDKQFENTLKFQNSSKRIHKKRSSMSFFFLIVSQL